MRRPLGVPLAASVLVASALFASSASASSVDELRQQQRQVQQRRAAQAARLDVARASARRVTQALDALEANLRSQRAVVAAAQQRVDAERARAAAAKAAEERTGRQLEGLRATVRQLAVDEFVQGAERTVDIDDDAATPMDRLRRRSLLSAAVGHSADVADQLQATRQDLEIERRAADEAAAAAAAEQQRLQGRLAELDAATKQQQAVAAEVEKRLEAQLAEAASLASVDRRLASQIVAEQTGLARRVAGSGGQTSGGSRRVGNVSVTTVRGITVATSIAGNVARLLDAADAAGISLGGSGYRDSSAQVATRRRNCGSSQYAIYTKPASACHPPTARPGQSMHERGLAIDFTSGGGTVSRGSAAYRWLSANAGRFGLRNLPGEPWHWSTTGD